MVYWISTSLLAGFLLLSSFIYIFQENTIQGLRDLGFPDFFRVQLAILKILAAVALLLPSIPKYVKEWAYAGTGLFLLTAMIAHIVHRDSIAILLLLVLLLAVLIISRITWL